MAETVLRQFGHSEREGPAGRVWVIDADHWPRALLRAELIERGYDAVGFVTVGDALAYLALRHAPPALAAIHLQGQAPNQLAPLLRGGFPVIAVGAAPEWATPTLRALPWASFLRRPLTLGAIADEVDRLLDHSSTSPK